MAVVDKAGTINNLSSVDTANKLLAENVTNGGKLKFVRDTVEVAAGDDDGSIYRLARIPSNAVIKEITINHDAITGGSDYDVGFYDIPDTNSGAVIDKDNLADGLDLSSGTSKDGLASVDAASLASKAWSLAGLSADPRKLVDVALTANTVGTAAGTITMTLVYALN